VSDIRFDGIDDDFEDDNQTCDGCGKPFGEGQCPLCCNNGGAYALGSEECDFCEYSDECALHMQRIARGRP